jgi:Protein of unknown function (DUF2877)
VPYCVGSLALKILDKLDDGQIGTIIQTFRNTVYVRSIDDHLICITSHDVKGPVNMNVDSNVEFGMVSMHQLVYKSNNTLRIGDLILPFRNISNYERERQSNISEGVEKRVFEAANLLRILVVEGSLLDSNSPFFQASAGRIKKILWMAKKGDFIGLQNSIVGLVGLGAGFTPSGDDFVAGFLYSLSRMGMMQSISGITNLISHRTSWHSRKFIEYAQEGFVIQQLEDFVDTLLYGTGEMITDSFLELIRIGHSSGIDSALGALIATSIKMNDAYCYSVLEKLGL